MLHMCTKSNLYPSPSHIWHINHSHQNTDQRSQREGIPDLLLQLGILNGVHTTHTSPSTIRYSDHTVAEATCTSNTKRNIYIYTHIHQDPESIQSAIISNLYHRSSTWRVQRNFSCLAHRLPQILWNKATPKLMLASWNSSPKVSTWTRVIIRYLVVLLNYEINIYDVLM